MKYSETFHEVLGNLSGSVRKSVGKYLEVFSKYLETCLEKKVLLTFLNKVSVQPRHERAAEIEPSVVSLSIFTSCAVF